MCTLTQIHTDLPIFFSSPLFSTSCYSNVIKKGRTEGREGEKDDTKEEGRKEKYSCIVTKKSHILPDQKLSLLIF